MLYPCVNVNSFIVKMESFTLELVKLEIRSSFVNMFFRLILNVSENKTKTNNIRRRQCLVWNCISVPTHFREQFQINTTLFPVYSYI